MYDKNNPWHRVSYGKDVPKHVNALIEIPKNSRAKYEIDKETGLLMLDRVIYSAMYYPANYGFIPQSYCEDGDPLDILVLSQIDLQPLCLVEAKVIGVMRMLDNGEMDDKIISVAKNDMSVNHYNDISELPPHFIKELRNFFEEYKKLEKKTVEIEDFLNASHAQAIVTQSIEDYRTKILPKVG